MKMGYTLFRYIRSPTVLESGQSSAILLPQANPIGAFISFTESAGTSATARESASPTDRSEPNGPIPTVFDGQIRVMAGVAWILPLHLTAVKL